MVELVGEYQTEGPEIIDIEASRGGRYRSSTVRGVRLTVEQLFQGDSELLQVQPSTYDSNPPRAWADDSRGIIFISVESIEQDAAMLNREIQNQVRQIQKYLEWLEKDVQDANSSMLRQLEGLLNGRKAEAEKRRKLESDLGIKLKPKKGPASNAIPLQKKRRLATPPSAESGGSHQRTPTISEDDYMYILDVCRGMGIMMERANESYAGMCEEDLRNVFVAGLNTHFHEQVTGETFNKAGKTDILVRSDNGNVFVGECKNWSGPQSLEEAITQVLRYLTWRDTKAAVLVFNRDNKDFSKIVDQISGIVQCHKAFDKVVFESSDSARFQYRVKKVDDEAIKIDLCILVFDLPKSNE